MPLPDSFRLFREAIGPLRPLTLGFAESIRGLRRASNELNYTLNELSRAIPLDRLEDFNRRILELQRFSNVTIRQIREMHQSFNQAEGGVRKSVIQILELRAALEKTSLAFQPLRREIAEALGKQFPYSTDRAISALARLNEQNSILVSTIAQGRLGVNQYAVIMRNYGTEVANVARRISDQRAGFISSTEGLKGYQVELLKSRQLLEDFAVKTASAFEGPIQGILRMTNAVASNPTVQAVGGVGLGALAQAAIPALLMTGARGPLKNFKDARAQTMETPLGGGAAAQAIYQRSIASEKALPGLMQQRASLAGQQAAVQQAIQNQPFGAPRSAFLMAEQQRLAQALRDTTLEYQRHRDIVRHSGSMMASLGAQKRTGLSTLSWGQVGSGALAGGLGLAAAGSLFAGSQAAGESVRGGFSAESMGSSLGGGALTGAMVGSMFGPLGMLIGSFAGLVVGGIANYVGQSNAFLAEIAENTQAGMAGVRTLAEFQVERTGTQSQVTNFVGQLNKLRAQRREITQDVAAFGQTAYVAPTQASAIVRDASGPIRDILKAQASIQEKGGSAAMIQLFAQAYTKAQEGTPEDRTKFENEISKQTRFGDELKAIKEAYDQINQITEKHGHRGIFDPSNADAMKAFADAAQRANENIEETRRTEAQLVLILQQRQQAMNQIAQLYQQNLQFQQQFFGGSVKEVRVAGQMAVSAAESRLQGALQSFNTVSQQTFGRNFQVQGIGKDRGAGAVISDLSSMLRKIPNLEEVLSTDKGLQAALSEVYGQIAQYQAMVQQAFDAPNQVMLEQGAQQRDILGSQFKMLEAMNRPLGERMAILQEQYSLEQGLLAVQAERVQQAEKLYDQGSISLTQLNSIKREYAGQAAAVAEMSRTIRREWEEQFTAITLGMQQGQYTLARQLSDYETLGPAFVPYQRPDQSGRPVGTVELLEAQRLGLGFRTEGERRAAIDTLRPQGSAQRDFMGSAGLVPGQVRDAQRERIELKLDVSEKANELFKMLGLTLSKAERDAGN